MCMRECYVQCVFHILYVGVESSVLLQHRLNCLQVRVSMIWAVLNNNFQVRGEEMRTRRKRRRGGVGGEGRTCRDCVFRILSLCLYV